MPRSARRAVTRVGVALAVLAGAAACEEHTVAVRFEPEVGDVYRFRAEIDTEVVRDLDGERTAGDEHARLVAEQTVRDVDGDEVVVRVELRQDDAPTRTVDVRLDRASRLRAIELVEGVPAESLGIDVSADLPADISSPPSGRLEPGDRWVIERQLGDGDRLTVRGHGRIDSLGVEDGRPVAVAIVELEVPVRAVVDSDAGPVRLVGIQRTRSETAYDLDDGAMRRDRTVTRGDVQVIAEPPPGVAAAPLEGELTYRIRSRTTRLDGPSG